MFPNNLPVPADRLIPAWSPVPQFVVPYQQPTQWQQYIPMIGQQCATIIANYSQRNPVRVFAYNLFSSNGWQNEPFIALVVFAIDYLSMLSETNQMRSDAQTTITQVCDDVVQGASVMNLNDYPALQQMLDQGGMQQAQGAMNNFQQMRAAVARWRQSKMQGMQPAMNVGMQPMGGMQPVMPGMMPMGGVMPGMQPVMPGMGMGMPMQQAPMNMGGDPRFNSGMVTQQQPAMLGGGVRYGMPGMPTTREEQRDLAKGMINMQREMMGGGGRWNKATDETIERMQGQQQASPVALGMGSAFDSRMRAQAEITPSSTLDQLKNAAPAASATTPLNEVSQDQTAMSTTNSPYPDGYFRNRKQDALDDQVFTMSLYKRCIADGSLPPDALSPYDTPPAEYINRHQPKPAVAPVPEVPSTATTQREAAEPAEGDLAATPPEPSPQAKTGRWWDEEEYQIPEPINSGQAALQEEAHYQNVAASEITDAAARASEVVDVSRYSDKPKADAVGRSRLGPEDLDDVTYEDEGHVHQWAPHTGQWYRPLYQPSRQVRMLKVYKDGRPSDLVVLDRNPEDIPNMDYAQHVLNTPSGRRERIEADADRALAAQKKIKEATDAYYQGVEEVKDNPGIVLENPVTSFDVSLITEVEGAESTVWMIGNVKRALREKEMQDNGSGESIDIFVSNALLYDAVYCRNESDITFLKSLYKQKNFADLHDLLKNCLSLVSKGVWETVNRRATAMLNQTLVLTMSLNEDVICPDFYSNYLAIATGMAQAPALVREAWERAQQYQMHMFFHEAREEDLKRNTDSLCYFLPDDDKAKESYLEATRYLASVCTFTQLSIDAADLDIALEAHEVALITEAATPVLCKVVTAIFDATSELGERKAINHLIRTEDGVVYQLSHGALEDGALLISKRQHLWVDAR
jgi:hypothetical protein